MKKLLLQYVSYNHWANARLADVLKELDNKLLDVEIKSSFPSLRKTVFHIWDAEVIWLNRLNNISLSTWPSNSPEYQSAAIDKFLEGSLSFLNLVESFSEEKLHEVLKTKNMKGVEYAHLRAEMIMHCMNHSTFHRGQLVTILRELGVTKLPGTDLINYLRVK